MHTQNLAYAILALIVLVGALAFMHSGGFTGRWGIFGEPQLASAGVSGVWKIRGRESGYLPQWKTKEDHRMNIEATPSTGGGGGSGGGSAVKDLDQKIADTLDRINTRLAKVDDLEKQLAEGKKTNEDFAKTIEEIQKNLIEIRKLGLAARTARLSAPRAGFVSDECARHLGALFVVAGLRQEKIPEERRVAFTKKVEEILGAEHKTALTSSDIPLPTQYSGEVVELVSEYGVARQYGTVFPLGSGTVKLPKLTTDTTFGLLTQSTAVTEKSPQVGWVTFSPEKFGGLIRLPAEIDEDSIIAMGQFLARYCARNIARVEDYNFFLSSGADSGADGAVKGLCLSVIDNSKVVQLGSGKTKYSDATLANVRSVRRKVDAPVIRTGKYYMHPTFEQMLSGFNTAGDKPYVAMAAKNPTLDGYEIIWVDTMPAYDDASAHASSVFILFGDISYQYLGVRNGIRFDTSKDAAFVTDETLIRCVERFTVGLMANGAVAGLETAAS